MLHKMSTPPNRLPIIDMKHIEQGGASTPPIDNQPVTGVVVDHPLKPESHTPSTGRATNPTDNPTTSVLQLDPPKTLAEYQKAAEAALKINPKPTDEQTGLKEGLTRDALARKILQE